MNRFETITFVYNEEFLLPFYLNHYSFVDRFNIIFDQDSNDRTLDILRSSSKVNIIIYKFPDMMDDDLKVQFINQIYKGLTDCYVINVDCDEFAFIESMPSTEISNVALSNVYRHISERALNCSLPIKEQRRHGFLDSRYVKPIVAKAGMDIAWTPGNHTLRGPARYFPVEYEGAHWANADPCFCVGRRIRDRRDRQSKHNLEKKLTYHHHGITAEDVLKECRDHQNDPMLW